jgi:hypothetical protein
VSYFRLYLSSADFKVITFDEASVAQTSNFTLHHVGEYESSPRITNTALQTQLSAQLPAGTISDHAVIIPTAFCISFP